MRALSVVCVTLLLTVGIGAGVARSNPSGRYSPYEAPAHYLRDHMLRQLRAKHAGPFAGEVHCGPTTHHTRDRYRCGLRLESGGLPSPCSVEAIISYAKPTGFRFDWREESRSCRE
jgi:hypothetical protein